MQGWWGALWLSVGLLGTVGAGAARAQVPEASENISEARALFMAGRVAFDEGRYEAALKHFEASYEQSQRPALLFNIAQCHDRMRRDEEALAAFERYLAVEPSAELRSSVEARVAALRAAVAARKPAEPARPADVAVAPAPETPSPAQTAPASAQQGEPRAWWQSAAVWTTAGGGALALTGGMLMALGHSHGRDVQQAEVGASYPSLQHDLDRADRQWQAGQGLLGLGAAAVAGGLTWVLLTRRERRTSARISLAPSQLFLSGRF